MLCYHDYQDDLDYAAEMQEEYEWRVSEPYRKKIERSREALQEIVDFLYGLKPYDGMELDSRLMDLCHELHVKQPDGLLKIRRE